MTLCEDKSDSYQCSLGYSFKQLLKIIILRFLMLRTVSNVSISSLESQPPTSTSHHVEDDQDEDILTAESLPLENIQ